MVVPVQPGAEAFLILHRCVAVVGGGEAPVASPNWLCRSHNWLFGYFRHGWRYFFRDFGERWSSHRSTRVTRGLGARLSLRRLLFLGAFSNLGQRLFSLRRPFFLPFESLANFPFFPLLLALAFAIVFH